MSNLPTIFPDISTLALSTLWNYVHHKERLPFSNSFGKLLQIFHWPSFQETMQMRSLWGFYSWASKQQSPNTFDTVTIKPAIEQTHKHVKAKSNNSLLKFQPDSRDKIIHVFVIKEKNLFHKTEICVTVYCRVLLLSEGTLIFRK